LDEPKELVKTKDNCKALQRPLIQDGRLEAYKMLLKLGGNYGAKDV